MVASLFCSYYFAAQGLWKTFIFSANRLICAHEIMAAHSRPCCHRVLACDSMSILWSIPSNKQDEIYEHITQQFSQMVILVKFSCATHRVCVMQRGQHGALVFACTAVWTKCRSPPTLCLSGQHHCRGFCSSGRCWIQAAVVVLAAARVLDTHMFTLYGDGCVHEVS